MRSCCRLDPRGVVSDALLRKLADVQVESAHELSDSPRRNSNSAARIFAVDPTKIDEAFQKGHAERSGKVVASLGPIKTSSCETSRTMPQGLDLDADLLEPLSSTTG